MTFKGDLEAMVGIRWRENGTKALYLLVDLVLVLYIEKCTGLFTGGGIRLPEKMTRVQGEYTKEPPKGTSSHNHFNRFNKICPT